MTTNACYPLVTVRELRRSRDFFVDHFGFVTVFEANWVVMLAEWADGDIRLGLMSPEHPSNPPGPEAFDGLGMIVTVQVDDAAAAFARVKGGGAAIHHAPKDEPWGQRRFMVRDPSGILVDVVEQTEPQPGWWDRYLE